MSVAAEYYTESAEGREGSSAEGAITAEGPVALVQIVKWACLCCTLFIFFCSDV